MCQNNASDLHLSILLRFLSMLSGLSFKDAFSADTTIIILLSTTLANATMFSYCSLKHWCTEPIGISNE